VNLSDVHLYDRALRLRHVHLSGWQRESLTWGSFLLAMLLALTGLVSPWGIVVLPAALAIAVKGHDLLLGRLPTAVERFLPDDLPAVGSRSSSSGADQAGETGAEPGGAAGWAAVGNEVPADGPLDGNVRDGNVSSGETPNSVPRNGTSRSEAIRLRAARLSAAQNSAAQNSAAQNRPHGLGAPPSAAEQKIPVRDSNEPPVTQTEGS
jgi:hypothetical protein